MWRFVCAWRFDGYIAIGNNDENQCDIADWTNIVAISAGGYHTIGVKPNGDVVATGYNEYGQCNVDDWDLW